LATSPFLQVKDIWMVERPVAGGHEQSGLHPAIVIAVNKNSPLCTIIPITSTEEMANLPWVYPIECSTYNGLMANSMAMVFQVTCSDVNRFKSKIGKLEPNHYGAVCALLKKYLQL
jgi:mRNA-degrading endonuclease toxin of MazEF toxin-antitoxin module